MLNRHKQAALIASSFLSEFAHLRWPFMTVTDGRNSLRRKAKFFGDFLSHFSGSRLSFDFFVSGSDGECFVARVCDNGKCLIRYIRFDVKVRAHQEQEPFTVGHIAEDQNVFSFPVSFLLLTTNNPVAESPLHSAQDRFDCVRKSDSNEVSAARSVRWTLNSYIAFAVRKASKISRERFFRESVKVHCFHKGIVPRIATECLGLFAVCVPTAEWIARRILRAEMEVA